MRSLLNVLHIKRWVSGAIFVLLLFCRTVAQAAEVVIAFGEAIPPYSFPNTHKGIELDVYAKALAFKGHTLKPVYYPLKRVPEAFAQDDIDAVMTDLGVDLSAVGGHYGVPAIIYNNAFITLAESNITIESPADLGNLSIISFYGAVKRYPDWLDGVVDKGNYHATSNQSLQILSLYSGHIDVVLSDINIFKYYSHKIASEKKISQKPVRIHQVLEEQAMNYRPVFKSQRVRDDFNEGIAYLKSTGEYKAIFDSYLQRD